MSGAPEDVLGNPERGFQDSRESGAREEYVINSCRGMRNMGSLISCLFLASRPVRLRPLYERPRSPTCCDYRNTWASRRAERNKMVLLEHMLPLLSRVSPTGPCPTGPCPTGPLPTARVPVNHVRIRWLVTFLYPMSMCQLIGSVPDLCHLQADHLSRLIIGAGPAG